MKKVTIVLLIEDDESTKDETLELVRQTLESGFADINKEIELQEVTVK